MPSPAASVEEEVAVGEDDATATAVIGTAGFFTLGSIAKLLWRDSYDELFDVEIRANELLMGSTGGSLPPSTYRAKLHGERASTYDARRKRQRRDNLAVELHANNMRHWSPSLIARSVTYLKKVSVFVEEVHRPHPPRARQQ